VAQSSRVPWPKPFQGLEGASWANAPREVAAGITLAALIIPLNIGYAQVAGLPPEFGLYAGIVPLAIFALFTGSRHLVTSPDASSAALVGTILIGFAPIGDPRVPYALALALVCGLLFLVFWLLRLAFLVNFLSRAVLIGFVSGLGVHVFTNQVRKILGAANVEGSGLAALAEQLQGAMAASVDTTGYFVEVIALIQSIPNANWYSVAIGLGTFVVLRLMKRHLPKVPAALAALIVMTVIVTILGLDQKGVSVLGSIPSGLPSLTLPELPLADYLRMLPGAMAIVSITLCEGLMVVRNCSRQHNTRADDNEVLFAYGMANMAAGFTGSMVTGNSPSRTAAVDSAGSRTQISSLVAAATVALVLVFFTKTLAYLPTAALAAVVANAVLNLIEVGELRELWHMRRSEFWVAIVCLLSVLVIGPLQAVIIAFLFSTIDLLRRASRPHASVLREAPDGSHFLAEEAGSAPDASGLVVYRFGAPLYFANASLFGDEVEQLITQATTPVKWLVLDMEAMVDIDTSGAEVLQQVLSQSADHGVTVAISRANAPTAALLAQYHLLDSIGENRLYPTNRHAIAAYRQEAVV